MAYNAWALTDHLGSVRDVIDSTGAVKDHIAYNSAGMKVSETDAAFGLLFGFTGRQFDADTGLQNNLHRWYDPKVGKWVSEDPIGFAAGDANLYRYVGNSPTRHIDPDGKQAAVAPALPGIGGTISGIGGAVGGVAGGAAIGATGYGSYCFGSWAAQYTTVPFVNWWYGVTPPVYYSPGLPLYGPPGGVTTKPGQSRSYDENGNPKTDTDTGHQDHMPYPHCHDWTPPTGGGPPQRGPARPHGPGDPPIIPY